MFADARESKHVVHMSQKHGVFCIATFFKMQSDEKGCLRPKFVGTFVVDCGHLSKSQAKTVRCCVGPFGTQ